MLVNWLFDINGLLNKRVKHSHAELSRIVAFRPRLQRGHCRSVRCEPDLHHFTRSRAWAAESPILRTGASVALTGMVANQLIVRIRTSIWGLRHRRRGSGLSTCRNNVESRFGLRKAIVASFLRVHCHSLWSGIVGGAICRMPAIFEDQKHVFGLRRQSSYCATLIRPITAIRQPQL